MFSKQLVVKVVNSLLLELMMITQEGKVKRRREVEKISTTSKLIRRMMKRLIK
jgi:uncharacterized protein with PQ loop repeat